MSAILKPLKWFYHEFGLASIHATGRDAYLIILARSFRMVASGAVSLILGMFFPFGVGQGALQQERITWLIFSSTAIFFSALDFSDHRIGLFMTLTLLGDLFLGTFLTLIADRVGRRKVLMGGSVLMMFSGLAFALFENFWILLIAAVFGVISITGGDFGPFRSIEE